MTCFTNVRDGMIRHSICPLTGRVGKGCGPSCPAHAPAQFTTFGARKNVLLVVTPEAAPSEMFTAVTSSPEEKSTPRLFAVLMTAAVSARGSTLRSFKRNTGQSHSDREGSNSESCTGSILEACNAG